MSFLDISALSRDELLELANIETPELRQKSVKKLLVTGKDLHKLRPEEVRRIEPLSIWQDLFCMCCFAFGVPGAAFTIPVVLLCVAYVVSSTLAISLFAMLIPLAFVPARFKESNLYSWASVMMIKYFSFKVIFHDFIPAKTRTILVAPPHGVFPFGNIITMLGFPSVMGYPFNGIASNAVFRTPIFRQILEWIDVMDASRATCERILNADGIIGISTGGVAEVFETDASMDAGDECVVLKSRKGLVKLALRTGADITPCYLFGHTKLLSCFTGGIAHAPLKALSRAIGFATILFWGRFLLPIPYRVPILGVLTAPIKVKKVPAGTEPTQKQIDDIHAELLARMHALFEEYKHLYGWQDKKLVIK